MFYTQNSGICSPAGSSVCLEWRIKVRKQLKILREMRLPRSGMETEGKVESDYPGKGSYSWIFEGKGTRWTSCQDNLLLWEGGWGKEMGDLWLLLLLHLTIFHGVKGCLECDPKFIEDIGSLLANLVPPEVPGRTHLLERQIKEMIRLSFKVSHGDKMLRVLGEGSLSPWEFGG